MLLLFYHILLLLYLDCKQKVFTFSFHEFIYRFSALLAVIFNEFLLMFLISEMLINCIPEILGQMENKPNGMTEAVINLMNANFRKRKTATHSNSS